MTPAPENPPALGKRTVWAGRYRDVAFEIKHREDRGEYFTENFPSGCWTFYVFLLESASPQFDKLWLEDTLSRISPDSPERVSHDYMQGATASPNFPGGITYYSKHGHTNGYRCVELGCDYQHSWDVGRHYTVAGITRDVMQAIDSCYESGLLIARTQPKPTP